MLLIDSSEDISISVLFHIDINANKQNKQIFSIHNKIDTNEVIVTYIEIVEL